MKTLVLGAIAVSVAVPAFAVSGFVVPVPVPEIDAAAGVAAVAALIAAVAVLRERFKR